MSQKNSSTAVFRASLPLTTTSFVNKCGMIGISLLPMILVERKLDSFQSSLVITLVKASLLIGTFVGGWLCDRIGMKRVVLASFACSALGLAGMPFLKDIFLLTLAAMTAQLGSALYNSPSRLLIVQLVSRSQQQEAIGWLRMANNMGQIVSYTLGVVFSTAGITVLILFDCFTSLAAWGLGIKLLPDPRKNRLAEETGGKKIDPAIWKLFIQTTLVVSGFAGLYEMFMVGSAAKYKLIFGAAGLEVYSLSMVINTVLCTGFAVLASKSLKNPNRVLPLGIFLTALGAGIALNYADCKPMIYLGMFIATVGEIAFTALAQFVLIRIIPEIRSQGSVYGVAMTVQVMGRIVGGALAFPLVVYGSHALLVYAVGTLPFLILCLRVRPGLAALFKNDGAVA